MAILRRTKTTEAAEPEKSERAQPIEVLVGQLFVVHLGPEGRLSEAVKPFLEHNFGGVFLNRDNLRSVDRVRRLTHRFRRQTRKGLPLVVSVDEEGGLVSHLSHLTTSAPSAAALGVLDDEAITRDVYQGIGEKARALGFNTVFAPVLDVNSETRNPVIGTRAFGSLPALVTKHGLAALDGLREAGVAACVKHFPGHGSTAADSHVTLPVVKEDLATLRARELAPFREAFARKHPPEMVMTAHVAYTALDGASVPATLSSRILQDVLRKELGFQGVVITDAMEMSAVSARMEPGKAALAALDAGADLLLYAMDPAMAVTAYQAVLDAARSGKLSEARIQQSVKRVQVLRRAYRSHPWLKDEEADEILDAEHEPAFFEAALKALVLEGNAGVLGEIPAAAGPKVIVVPRELNRWYPVPVGVVREQMEPAGFTVVEVGAEPTPEEIGSAESRSSEASVVVVATASRGPMNEENRTLVEALTRRDVIKVGAALLDPADADRMLTANCRIKTFGFAVPQVWAMCQKLLG